MLQESMVPKRYVAGNNPHYKFSSDLYRYHGYTSVKLKMQTASLPQPN